MIFSHSGNLISTQFSQQDHFQGYSAPHQKYQRVKYNDPKYQREPIRPIPYIKYGHLVHQG